MSSNPPRHHYYHYYPHDQSQPPTTASSRYGYAPAHVPHDLQNPTYSTYQTQNNHPPPQSQLPTITRSDNGFSYPDHHSGQRTAYSSLQICGNNSLMLPGEQLTTASDDYIQRLRDEVVFLHGLWHRGHLIPAPNPEPRPEPQILHDLLRRGPSIPNPVPNLSPNPQILLHNWHQASSSPAPVPNLSHNPQIICPLKSSQTTSFKKKKNKKKKKRQLNPLPISDKEWPVLSQPADPPSDWCAWPDTQSSSAAVRMATEEEKTSICAMRVQQRGLDSFRVLLGGKSCSSPELDSETESEDEDDDDRDDQGRFECFSKVFQEFGELKGYYEKNWEHGLFCCLVCRGIGYKIGKKYKNLVALVQHTVSISKTKRTRAHRTYGLVICDLLGWDVNRLPSISDNPSSELVHETGDAAQVGMHSSIGVEKDITSVRSDNTESDTNHCFSQPLPHSVLGEGESITHVRDLAPTEDHDNTKNADTNAGKDISTAAGEILKSANNESDLPETPKCTPEITEDSSVGNDKRLGNEPALSSVEGDDASKSMDLLGQGQ